MAERDDTITEIFVGAAVVIAAAGFFVYAASSAGGLAGGADAYELTASFRSAEGIGVGTEVRLAGVRVGTVTGMDLDPETFRAETTFSRVGSLELPDDSARSRRRGSWAARSWRSSPAGRPSCWRKARRSSTRKAPSA
jgi:phospholipid/cholesterol/gamma-HCH transport system substrate-binding protein